MKILIAQQMSRWDDASIRKHKVSAIKLMSAAAEACFREIQNAPGYTKEDRAVVVCGPGNNGGDGFALAEELRKDGLKVVVFFLGRADGLSEAAHYFFEKCQAEKRPLSKQGDLKFLRRSLKQADWVVDAIFGIGLSRPLKGLYASAVREMNAAKGFKLAIDIPSGISADTGKSLGLAFQADCTVTFEAPKWGQLEPSAWDSVGRLKVAAIGLTASENKKFASRAEWLDAETVRAFLHPRSLGTHKGQAGRVLVLAGSSAMPGAGYLSSLAALRAGAGLVVWALPEEAFRKIDLRYPEVILKPLASVEGKFHPDAVPELAKDLKTFAAMALGPGLGQGRTLAKFLTKLLQGSRLPRVIDADALNGIAQDKSLLSKLRGAILTPHFKEFSRLCGKPIPKDLASRVAMVSQFAKKHQVYIVLKGYRSIVSDPKGKVWINSSGGPNLATAGSGDVLTGLIAGLLAQGLSERHAILAGVYLHGRAGDCLEDRLGDRGTIASDLLQVIPQVIRGLL